MQQGFQMWRVAVGVLSLAAAVGCSSKPAAKLDCESEGCAQACITSGAACSADTASCCPGTSCFNGACVCSAKGETCGTNGQTCCGGLECDPSGHCSDICSQPRGACHSYGDPCSADTDCCSPAACRNGFCADTSVVATCKQEGQSCASATDCCGSSALGSQLDCVTAGDGGMVCHRGQVGESCDTNRLCATGLHCISTVDGGTAGTCDVVKTAQTCILTSSSCSDGDSCDPEATVNEGYDPCYIGAQGQNLGYRATARLCKSGFCAQPSLGDPCSGSCEQAVGDSRRTTCLRTADGSRVCLASCSFDNDCTGAMAFDNNNFNPPAITSLCVSNGGGKGCQPQVCYLDDDAKLGDPNVLYKPCFNHEDTMCLPRFYGDGTRVAGFCTASRSALISTVGKPCDMAAGREAKAAICGTDALCMGGRCAALCDAATLGTDGVTPGCTDPALTCISMQGLDLVSDYQVGGCNIACHPFAKLEDSGCVSFCGGPPTRCNWIVGDGAGNQPRGYCAAALKAPVAVGQSCRVASASDPCESGARCMLADDGVSAVCKRLCDPMAIPGSRDACPTGTCTAFDSLTRSGYCK